MTIQRVVKLTKEKFMKELEDYFIEWDSIDHSKYQDSKIQLLFDSGEGFELSVADWQPETFIGTLCTEPEPMHDRCHLEGCICKCHKEIPKCEHCGQDLPRGEK